MKRPSTSRRYRLLALWLVAFACQRGELFSQENEVYTAWEDAPQPLGNMPQNGQWPAFSNSEIAGDYDAIFPEASSMGDDSYDRSIAYQDSDQPYSTFDPSSQSAPPQKQTEKEELNFVAFPASPNPSTSQEAQHPLSEEGRAVSHPFNSEGSTVSSQLSSLADFIAQTTPPEETAPNAAPPTAPQSISRAFESAQIREEPPSPAAPAVRKPEDAPIAPAAAEPEQESQIPAPEVQTPEAPRPPTIITPSSPGPAGSQTPSDASQKHLKEISINFNNVSMIEYIRFISRISNKNFIFDEENLQFNVTIVSEEPTTVENLMAALLQELKIRDLSLLEQGNNIIIHRNPRVRSPARIYSDGTAPETTRESELVTRVFRLNTLDPVKASEIIRPLLSEDALVEVLRDTNNLIITDLVTTVNKIAQLIDTLDAPNSGVTIGQYVVRNAFVDSLVDLGTKILQPIAQGNPFVLVPHPVSNSIFIVSNSFIVEKALAILQNLDLNEGKTKILSLEGLQPTYEGGPGMRPGGPGQGPLPGGGPGRGPAGAAPSGNLPYGTEGYGQGYGQVYGQGYGQGYGPGGQRPQGFTPGGEAPAGGYGPEGTYTNAEGVPESFPLGGIGVEGHPFSPQFQGAESYRFAPGGIGTEGRRSSIFEEGRQFAPGGIGASSRWARELPLGHIERTMFFIYKLRYRKGDVIEIALRKIANSLQLTGTANADLISAINSSQWIDSTNSLIFTGTAGSLEKVRELILEVDVPLRQVFIEMLILNTSIQDSLSYGVDWINRFGGGQTTGEQGFIGVDNPGFKFDSNNPVHPTNGNFPIVGGPTQDHKQFFEPTNAFGANSLGAYTAGIIGTHLTHNGMQFATIGALVRAVHSDTKSNIILNPKIITEDNNTAEIFVGGTDRYKTQSITNDLGSLVTNNFQFIDVGTTLRVTPLIGNNDIITLDIIQETTHAAPNANSGAVGQNVNLVQVLTKSRSVTKVHVPNGFFVVMSGMINDQESRRYERIPCLGGIPIIGAACKHQQNDDIKHNLMLFIRPLIIDTDEDLEDITKRQQDVFNEKTKFRRSWNYEIDEGLNFLNIKPTDPDEIGCDE